MAERRGVFSKFEEQIRCPVCFDTFKEPKQLQCHHVYCRGCLVKLVEKDEQGLLVLPCPTCRKITPVPVNGVKGLQPAFQVNNLLEIEGPLKEALTPSAETANRSLLSCCPEHAGEEIKLFCEKCKTFICIKCVVSGARHHSHSYKTLDSYRGDILSLLEPVKSQLSTTSNAAEQIDTQCTVIRDQQADMDVHLDQTFGQLHEMLDARKTELKSQLCHLADNKVKILKSQKEQIMASRTQLQKCEGDVHEKLQQLNDDREVVAMKHSVATQINELTSTFRPEAMKPISVADMELTLPDNLPALLKIESYGTLYCKELQPDPSKCSVMNTACLESAEVGRTADMIVQAVNHFGDPCVDTLPTLEFKLVSEIGAVVKRGRCEGSQGHYVVPFTPAIKGYHKLRVMINGRPTTGSPFTVHVKSSVKKLAGQIMCIFGVSRPWGIAVSKKRQIFVSESHRHCISVYSASGRKLRSFGSKGLLDGQFKKPHGIALDDSGNVVVADHDNNRIQMFTEDGQFLKTVGSKGQLNGPNAITFNECNRRFYVTNVDGYVRIFSHELSYIGAFGGISVRFAEGKLSAEIWGISCDSSGQVYVTDTVNSRVHIFTAGGIFLKVFGKAFGGPFDRPAGIAVDAEKFMYVCNQYGNTVQILTTKGELVKAVGVHAKGQGKLNYPRNIAVDKYGVLYVCDNNNDHICMF